MIHHRQKAFNEKQKDITEMPPREAEARRIIRVMSGRIIVIIGAVIIILFLLVSAIGPWIAPYNPYKLDLTNTLQQPSMEHLLGTDAYGRDTLSRLIYGTRISLMVGVLATSIAAAIGMTLGIVAGYFGGWTNTIIMRIVDTLMSLPPLVLMLSIAAVLGGGLKNVMIAIGIGMMPTYCRLSCGQILALKESDYIKAAVIIGSSNIRIMFRHLLLNAFPPLLVLITMNIGMVILMEAGLSFLGIGVIPPEPTWGSMVNEGYKYLLHNPILSFAPGVAIILVVLSFNMVGDGLRDALDPRLRGTL